MHYKTLSLQHLDHFPQPQIHIFRRGSNDENVVDVASRRAAGRRPYSWGCAPVLDDAVGCKTTVRDGTHHNTLTEVKGPSPPHRKDRNDREDLRMGREADTVQGV